LSGGIPILHRRLESQNFRFVFISVTIVEIEKLYFIAGLLLLLSLGTPSRPAKNTAQKKAALHGQPFIGM
jgi:hypothetical protein